MRTTPATSAVLPAIVLFALIVLAPLAGADSLRVGYFDLPPHTPETGQADSEGAVIAYFGKIAKHMQLDDVSYQRYPLSRLLRMLEHGNLDMALILAKSVDREKGLVFPAAPFAVVQSILLLPPAASPASGDVGGAVAAPALGGLAGWCALGHAARPAFAVEDPEWQ